VEEIRARGLLGLAEAGDARAAGRRAQALAMKATELEVLGSVWCGSLHPFFPLPGALRCLLRLEFCGEVGKGVGRKHLAVCSLSFLTPLWCRLASFLVSAPLLLAHFRSYAPSVALRFAQQSFFKLGLLGKGTLDGWDRV
jgi:hypothetical protein